MLIFLEGLDKDIQLTLLQQLRDIWTHTSTAIEGNTLSLGDTKFILEEGLTVSGKPIKDHEEVIGHAKAIDLIYDMLDRPITEDDFFNLHKAVQVEQVADIYKPYGAWKIEPNGTYTVDQNGQQVFLEYAHPNDVAVLMQEIIEFINKVSASSHTLHEITLIYAKVHMGVAHIHPFWDGNGRVARLVANIPLLRNGFPPIVISKQDRQQYIDVLAQYQRQLGCIDKATGVWPKPDRLMTFVAFCQASYSHTQSLIERAQTQQKIRDGKR